jgi:hypothetical protein
VLAQFSFDAGTDVFPRNALRFAGHHPSRSSLDFGGPCRLNLRGVLGTSLVKTGQEFGRNIGAFVSWQCQRFSKKFLRSRGHEEILHRDGAAQHRGAPDRR